MSPSHALFGLVVVAVPTAAVLFGLAAMGINHFRKPPQEKRKKRTGSTHRPDGRPQP